MFGLGKKKDKSKKKEDPPLPDELPLDSGPMMQPPPGMPQPPAPENDSPGLPSGMPENKQQSQPSRPPTQQMPQEQIPDMPDDIPEMTTHDKIPNDIEVPNDFSPNNLPETDELPEVEAANMPEVPDVPEGPPIPDIDDDVPKPPAIFTEEGFYDTPEEIKHLVEKKDLHEEYAKKYHLQELEPAEIPEEDIEIQKYKTEGPLFVDIDAFRTMLTNIDTIKNNVKASNDILNRLNDIRNAKDEEMEKWRSSLEDVQRKLNYIDKIVYKEAA